MKVERESNSRSRKREREKAFYKNYTQKKEENFDEENYVKVNSKLNFPEARKKKRKKKENSIKMKEKRKKRWKNET